MDLFKSVPDWLGTAIVGAVFAAVGYGAKALLDWRERRWQERVGHEVRLHGFSVLLEQSCAFFAFQQTLVKRLMESLKKTQPEESAEGIGYEAMMARCYDRFTDGERELHGLIRFYT